MSGGRGGARPGAGRPSIGPAVTVRLSPEALARIDSARGDQSRAGWVRGAIDERLEREDQQQPAEDDRADDEEPEAASQDSTAGL